MKYYTLHSTCDHAFNIKYIEENDTGEILNNEEMESLLEKRKICPSLPDSASLDISINGCKKDNPRILNSGAIVSLSLDDAKAIVNNFNWHKHSNEFKKLIIIDCNKIPKNLYHNTCIASGKNNFAKFTSKNNDSHKIGFLLFNFIKHFPNLSGYIVVGLEYRDRKGWSWEMSYGKREWFQEIETEENCAKRELFEEMGIWVDLKMNRILCNRGQIAEPTYYLDLSNNKKEIVDINGKEYFKYS